MGSDSDSCHSGILAHTKEEIEEQGSPIAIKVEHDTFTSDTKSFQPAVIKNEDDELSAFEFKYNKEYMTWEEGTSSSRKMENNPVRCVSAMVSADQLTFKVDLGVMKMEKDEDTIGESHEVEDTESGEHNSANKINRFKHMRTNGVKFDCIKCRREFSSKRDIDCHIVAWHSNNAEMMNSVTSNIHHCKNCKYITVYANKLTQHTRTHGDIIEKTFGCIKCRKEFSGKRDLDGHIVARHNNNVEMMNRVTSKIHHCKNCKYITVFPYKLTQHMRTHGEKFEKTFDCIKCKKELSSKRDLDDHIVARHSNNVEMMNNVTSKIFRCKHCTYITVIKRSLNKLMRMHGEKLEKTFDCTNCKKQFQSKFCLDSHIVARHSNNDEMMNSVTCRIHHCKHCRYITVTKKHLIRHMNTHGEKLEETFDCVQCQKKFSTKRDLDGHIVAWHGNNDEMMDNVTSKIHRCEHCKYITAFSARLIRHTRTHGKEKGNISTLYCD